VVRAGVPGAPATAGTTGTPAGTTAGTPGTTGTTPNTSAPYAVGGTQTGTAPTTPTFPTNVAGSVPGFISGDATAMGAAGNLANAQYMWGANQFNQVWPYAQNYLNNSQANAATASNLANTNAGLYTNLTAPTLALFTNTANTYNSPARAALNSQLAQTDVANQFQSARNTALANLESYGIDPSQTRFGALDLSTRISQAAAQAAAATQSRIQTENTGLGLQSEAINAGMNLPGMVSTGLTTAANVGGAGINAANNTSTTGANIMGTPTNWAQIGNQAGQIGGTLNLGQNSLQYQQQQNQSAGVGSLIGGALGALGSSNLGTNLSNIGSNLLGAASAVGTGISKIGSFLGSVF